MAERAEALVLQLTELALLGSLHCVQEAAENIYGIHYWTDTFRDRPIAWLESFPTEASR